VAVARALSVRCAVVIVKGSVGQPSSPWPWGRGADTALALWESCGAAGLCFLARPNVETGWRNSFWGHPDVPVWMRAAPIAVASGGL